MKDKSLSITAKNGKVIALNKRVTLRGPVKTEAEKRKIESLARIYGLFARLAEPIDYKAIDGRPVDLVFLLLSPANAGAEHLKALAAISRVTRNEPALERMRGARSRDALAAVLMGADERDAA